MKTSELTGAALDWAVSIAEGFKPAQLYISKYPNSPASIYTCTFDDDGKPDGYMTGPDRLYSRKWEAGGPIIERECIMLDHDRGFDSKQPWRASLSIDPYNKTDGPTPLIAAMRCYVASKLGDNINIPEELL
jgi:hypothetical protein